MRHSHDAIVKDWADRATIIHHTLGAKVGHVSVRSICYDLDLSQKRRCYNSLGIRLRCLDNFALLFIVIIPVRITCRRRGELVHGARHIPPYNHLQIVLIRRGIENCFDVFRNPLQPRRVVISVGFGQAVLKRYIDRGGGYYGQNHECQGQK